MTEVSAASMRARERIRHAALLEFQRRGFVATTMDHIRVAAELSRGGLYYQYGSTEEILFDLLAQERAKDAGHAGAGERDGEGAGGVAGADPFEAGFADFLEEQRTSLTDIDTTLRPVAYEFLLGLEPARRREIMRAQFRDAEAAVATLLPHTGDDAARNALARHIVRRLEGLSLAAMAGALDDNDLTAELDALRLLAAKS